MNSSARPCPACQHPGPHHPLRVTEMWFSFDETFDYWTCGDCGSVFIAEVPTDLARHYAPDKYYSLQPDAEAVLGRPGVRQAVAALGRSVLSGRDVVGSLFERTPVRNVHMMATGFAAVALADSRRGTKAALLDVGAGSGLLVYALHLAGMRGATGIDPFLDADVHYANGAMVRKGDLSEVDERFDVVMLNHSFEHVPDPAAMLDEVKQRLVPGGRVVVRVPTVSSAAYRNYGVDWYGLDAPRHLTLFSRDGMERLVQRCGYRTVKTVDDSNAVQFWASEQIRAGIPLASDRSHYIDQKHSSYSFWRVARWEREARQLNAQNDGDQVAWVLEVVA